MVKYFGGHSRKQVMKEKNIYFGTKMEYLVVQLATIMHLIFIEGKEHTRVIPFSTDAV